MQGQSTRVARVCLRCGTHFTIKASVVSQGRGIYCSNVCRCGSRPERSCLACGASFTVKPGRAASGRGRYCSIACARKSQYAPPEVRFWQRVRQTAGCWLWTGFCQKGYGALWVDGKWIKAHRFSYQLFYGDLRSDDFVLHLCDVRNCVSPGHLMKGDQAENMRQAFERGRMTTPSTVILTPDTVRELRRLYDEGWSFPQLAERFGIVTTSAADVIYQRTWRHIV